MSVFDGLTTERGAAHFLERAGKNGVKMWFADGELHYKAPKGVMTSHDVELLRASRTQIVNYLQSLSSPITQRAPGDLIPLTFSQLAHWQTRGLGHRPG